MKGNIAILRFFLNKRLRSLRCFAYEVSEKVLERLVVPINLTPEIRAIKGPAPSVMVTVCIFQNI